MVGDTVQSRRAVLSVISPHSGCGKSLLVAHLLRQLGGLGCLKISPIHELPGGVPDSEEDWGGDYYLEEPNRLRCPGKDTAVYLAAGAVRVERVRHRKQGLAAGLEAALKRFPVGMPIVVESSSAIPMLAPAAVVLVVRPPLREMKPSTRRILPSVTDLLMNVSGRTTQQTCDAEWLLERYAQLRPQKVWSVDLNREPPPADMLRRLRELLGVDDGESADPCVGRS